MPQHDYLDVEDAHQNVSHRVIWDKTKDDGDQQLISYKGLAGEQHTEVLRVMPHGLSSHSPAGSEGVVIGMASRDMPVVVGGESPKHRPRDLPEGATRLYDSADGFVYLDAGGNLHAKVTKGATIEAGEAVTVKAATVTIEGDVVIKGNITHTGNMTTSGIHTDSSGPHTA